MRKFVAWLVGDLRVFLMFMLALVLLVVFGVDIVPVLKRAHTGSSAEWFAAFAAFAAGIATAVVAFMAWRTSRDATTAARDAATVASRSLEYQMRGAAGGITWWLERAEGSHSDLRADTTTYRNFLEHVDDAALYGRWPELEPDQPGDMGFMVIVVKNSSASGTGGVRVAFAESQDVPEAYWGWPLTLGFIPPETTVRALFPTDQFGESPKEYSTGMARMQGNEAVEWVEFTAPSGDRWRRGPAGELYQAPSVP